MINIAEVWIANGTGILLMVFFLLTRKWNKDNNSFGERVFNGMVWLALTGCAMEIVGFILDGDRYPGSYGIIFTLDSLLYLIACTVGCLWCFYVDFRIYNNYRRVKKMRWLRIPLVIDALLLCVNAIHPGFLFTISVRNVYIRGLYVWLTYPCVVFYCVMSVIQVLQAKKKGVRVKFFPIVFFLVPCMTGVAIQWAFYGIAVGWLALSISLWFVYILFQSESSYVDSLSGLYNRKYLDYIMEVENEKANHDYYGIMMDLDRFKSINDNFGHLTGDDAIYHVGKLLAETVSENCTAIRYAGDEFIVLMETQEKSEVEGLVSDIQKAVQKFNLTNGKKYKLSLSMGISYIAKGNSNMEAFLAEMDKSMYEKKRRTRNTDDEIE